MAEALSKSLNQSAVVENKPGAASQIGIDMVAKAKPDGYTLLWTSADGRSMNRRETSPTISEKRRRWASTSADGLAISSDTSIARSSAPRFHCKARARSAGSRDDRGIPRKRRVAPRSSERR